MMRRQVLFVLASAIAFLLWAAPVFAQSLQPSASASLCVYDSKNYSDGAYICAQKSMMLTCQSDGVKATWKMVADKDINERCTSPIARPHIAEPRRYRRYAVRPLPAADPSAKCFNFNGKRYCE